MATGSGDDGEFERYAAAAAAGGVFPPRLNDSEEEISTAGSMFTEDEYDECDTPLKQVSRGFAFLPVDELDSMAETWPDTGTFQSTNFSLLRGLAVTYFYQSRMSKARELLLKVWETDPDLEVALMLAECACAIKDTRGESFETALHRICVYVGSSGIALTEQHVIDWDEKLDELGRFMGYFILRYALYRERMSHLAEGDDPANVTFEMVKKIALRLINVVHEFNSLTTSQSVLEAIACILMTLKNEVDEYPDTLEQALAEVDCCESLSEIYKLLGETERAAKFMEEAKEIMRSRCQERAPEKLRSEL